MCNQPNFEHSFQQRLTASAPLPPNRAFKWLRSFAVVLGFLSLVWVAGCASSNGGQMNNPVPTVSSVNPTSTTAGNSGFMVTVTGTGFVSTSTVQWSGSARVTTYVSSTQLQAAVTAADVAAAGTVSVTVSSPAPGGGVSGAVMFTIDNLSPTLASLNPNSAFAGGGGFTLNVTGTNFVSTSTVLWNGSPRTTTFGSSTLLQAAIPGSDIAMVGTALVEVSNPSPGGGTSGTSSFTIEPPPPIISQLTPSSAIAGSGGFTLNVNGTNFVNTSAVQWNGVSRTTTFVSPTQLQAVISSADVAAIGVSQITVSNPAASGGNSTPSTFFTGSFGGPGYAVVLLNQSSTDLVYDPAHQVIYFSVQNSAATNPNTISVLGLSSAGIVSSTPAGSQPDILAISDDSKFLYAGIDGSSSVQRFTLPGLAKDINFSLGGSSFGGPFFALDLQVAPGFPHTTAISLAVSTSTPSAQGGITIFDDGTARPTIAKGFGPGGGGGVLYDSLQWGSDATTLFAANNEDTGFDFYTLAVNSSGVTLNKDFPNAFSSFFNRIHYDPGTKLVYADEGHVVDPTTGNAAGNFATSGVMVPDSTLTTAFFAASLTPNNITIQSFDLTHFTTINSVTFSIGNGNPVRLIRWGQNGLAFITNGGQVGLVGGNFIH